MRSLETIEASLQFAEALLVDIGVADGPSSPPFTGATNIANSCIRTATAGAKTRHQDVDARVLNKPKPKKADEDPGPKPEPPPRRNAAGIGAIERRQFRTPLGATSRHLHAQQRPAGVEHSARAARSCSCTAPPSGERRLRPAVDGRSWMDHIASAGFDVWLMDLPVWRLVAPEGDGAPAADNPPPTTTDVAIASVRRVVDFIRRERGIERRT